MLKKKQSSLFAFYYALPCGITSDHFIPHQVDPSPPTWSVLETENIADTDA
jgi:hypothetical protein